MNSSKFYPKSLTLLLPVLQMIDSGVISSDIAKSLNKRKSHVTYYIRKAKDLGYVKESPRSAFKILELTQAGKSFLAMYTNLSSSNRSTIIRAENIRFKADIIKMPPDLTDWHKVEMNNWTQYCIEMNGVKVHINNANHPTIEFIHSPIEGNNVEDMRSQLLQDCIAVRHELEERLDMRIGRLNPSSKGEWVVYDPIAKSLSNQFGQITVEGVGKVNASKPRRRGEFEWFDPRDCADYMVMPKRLANIEQQIDEIKNLLKVNE
jgi:DNA-binding MarR family transcriptional regulator